MSDSDWAKAVETIRAHTVKVETPSGSGTGFLITYREQTSFYGIATAYHVIQHAHDWGEPIRLTHADSGVSRFLSISERFILVRAEQDVAIVLFSDTTLGLPKNPLLLGPANRYLRTAWHIGWLGYPALAGGELCFFEGVVSCALRPRYSYLVDGVAINGVSGGPAFMPVEDNVCLIGLVSAYIANRATGETLPGVCVVQGIHAYHDFIATIKSLEDAEAKKDQFESEPIEKKDEAPPTSK